MSAIRELARINPNLRKVAALLQAKGRYGDTMLAHITPREAQMLKEAGGAGTTNPETGLLEFYDWEGSFTEPTAEPVDYSQYGAQPADVDPGVMQPFPQEMSFAAPQQFAGGEAPQMPAGPGLRMPVSTPPATPMAPVETRAVPPDLQRPGMEPGTRQALTQLGVAGLQSLPGILAARRMATQARGAQQQQQQIASPYQQMGRQLQAQAAAGQLTPQGQQALQAARAQMAQAAQARGGVGAQQATMQLEQFRQNLLQQQMDYGLKLSGIGDQIALGAIKTGMQADQQVADLTQQFFSNLFQRALPSPQGAQPGQPRPGP